MWPNGNWSHGACGMDSQLGSAIKSPLVSAITSRYHISCQDVKLQPTNIVTTSYVRVTTGSPGITQNACLSGLSCQPWPRSRLQLCPTWPNHSHLPAAVSNSSHTYVYVYMHIYAYNVHDDIYAYIYIYISSWTLLYHWRLLYFLPGQLV